MTGSGPQQEIARRIAGQADEIIDADVAQTAASGRIGKVAAVPPPTAIAGPPSIGPDRVSASGFFSRPFSTRAWGCLSATVLIVLAALAVLLSMSGGAPGPSPFPSSEPPARTPASSGTATTPAGSSTSTPTSLADYAHSLAPPDIVSVRTDKGGEVSHLYEVVSSRSVPQLDGYYMDQLPLDGWTIGGERRFDSRVIFEIGRTSPRIDGLVSLQADDAGARVEIQVAAPPPDGAGGGGRLSTPDDAGDAVTDSGHPIDDPEVDITQTTFQKVGDSYRVTVSLAAALVSDYSFALLVRIGTETEAVAYLWEIHGTPSVLRVGQMDSRTGQIIAGEAEGVMISYDRTSGMATFEFPGSQLPEGTDRYNVTAFHSPAEGEERRTDVSRTATIGFLICGGACQ